MILHKIVEEAKSLAYAMVMTLITLSFSIGVVYVLVKVLK